MVGRKLKMNDAKTEHILIGTQHQLAKCTNKSINVGDSLVQATYCVRNLDANFDKHTSIEKRIMKCRAAYAQLYNISKIRRYFDHQVQE